MLDKPIADCGRNELNAELDLYREALGHAVDVPSFGLMAKNADRIEAVTKLQAEHGIPVRLTPDFMQDNPALAKFLLDGGAVEGQIVFGKEADIAESVALDAKARAEADGGHQPAYEGKPSSATVYDQHGHPARTYSLDIHGKSFRQLAEGYAKKRGWTVR